VSAASDLIFTRVQYPASISSTKTGWTVGGGLEWAFTRSWSAKIEGLYYDLGSVTTAAGSVPIVTGFTFGKQFDANGGIVRAGLNYRFN